MIYVFLDILAPGTRHAYSNLGYLALGLVIETVTGQTYEQYVTTLLKEIGVTSLFVGKEMRVDWQADEVCLLKIIYFVKLVY